MKKLFLLIVVAAMALNLMAQVYPTNFLGIPIDGTKQEMMKKIQDKGFVYDHEHDCLKGQFNGSNVYVHIATNKDKVWRVMVSEVNFFSESQIRIRFNNLMNQFMNNTKYLSGDINQDYIPDDEDISYQMSVNNKEYIASFAQITHKADSAKVVDDAKEIALKLMYDLEKENIQKNTENISTVALYQAYQKQYLKNLVWFKIAKFEGKYNLVLYYDNGYNKANGEDL